MVIGVCTLQLSIPVAQSLKEKRQVIKSLKDRLHARFNVSASETAHQDLHQRAELAMQARVTVIHDAAGYIESAITNVRGTALWGAGATLGGVLIVLLLTGVLQP
mgnify:CR=1 FL=1